MGSHKKTHCLKGHLLEEPNLRWNGDSRYPGESFRECKICANARAAKSQRERRRALSFLKLIVLVGEKRVG